MKNLSDNINPNEQVIIRLYGAATIPVGHNVNVCVFAVKQSFFKGLEPEYNYPLITDLETGINYGNLLHFCPPNDFSFSIFFNTSPMPNESLQVFKEFKGIVRSCNVLSYKNANDTQTQTTLVIEAI